MKSNEKIFFYLFRAIYTRDRVHQLKLSGLVGITIVLEHRVCGFTPRYRHRHDGLDIQLKWLSSLTGVQANELQAH